MNAGMTVKTHVWKFHFYDLWSMTFREKLTVIVQRCCSTIRKLYMLLLLLGLFLLTACPECSKQTAHSQEDTSHPSCQLWLLVNTACCIHTYSLTVCCEHAMITQPCAIPKVWLPGNSWLYTVLSGRERRLCFNVFALRLRTSQLKELRPTDVVSGWSLPLCTPCSIVFFCHWMF